MSKYQISRLPPLALVCRFKDLSNVILSGVLGDEFAADSEVEDGLAELLDVLDARGEAREVAEVEAGVLA